MRRLLFLLIMTAIVLVPISSMSAAASEPRTDNALQPLPQFRIYVDGQEAALSKPPALVSGTLLVPARDIFTALHTPIKWIEQTKSLTASMNGIDVMLTLNSNTALVNGKPAEMKVAPVLNKGSMMVPLRFICDAFGYRLAWNGTTEEVHISTHAEQLPVVGSYEKLTKLLEQAADNEPAIRIQLSESVADNVAAAPAPEAKSENSKSGASADFSATNTQVQGVDESDIVKTDGTYIYTLNRQKVIVARAIPAERMSVAATVSFAESTFAPTDLYVDDKHMIVIGTKLMYEETYMKPQSKVQPGIEAQQKIAADFPLTYRPAYAPGVVAAKIYDIGDKSKITLLREFEMEGNYVSSRMIGSRLYLIANRYAGMNQTYYMGGDGGNKPDPLSPFYRDTTQSGDYVQLPYDRMYYFPDFVDRKFLLIAGIDTDRPQGKADISAYLGSGDSVYASGGSIYVASAQYGPSRIRPLDNAAPATSGTIQENMRLLPVPDSQPHTSIYKFKLDNGKAVYWGEGEVPGTLLNQFSMDESDGYFRIATTTGNMWARGEDISKNNVYVLDDSLVTIGKLENIAPGEKIYSVRFMGKRAYMVTFKNVDPLFVLDLGNPRSPSVLGALKIPGYSDYLHPYDENHIIGFGKDTVELSDEFNPDSTRAYYMGMKIALFDVTDVTKPVEQFKTMIGDRGTGSELLNNHKALLFSKEKKLLAFPVTVAEVKENDRQQTKDFPAYGQFTFQGAYVYNIDLIEGFKLKVKITHLSDDELLKSGNGWYDSGSNIKRILYIGDTLYTVSDAMIKANDMNSMKEKGTLALP